METYVEAEAIIVDKRPEESGSASRQTEARGVVLPAIVRCRQRAVCRCLRRLVQRFRDDGIRRAAELVKCAARRYGLLGFVGQKGEFESGGFVLRVEIQSLFELIAGLRVITCFEQRVSEIFVSLGVGGLKSETLLEEGDGGVVVLCCERFVTAIEVGVAGSLGEGGGYEGEAENGQGDRGCSIEKTRTRDSPGAAKSAEVPLLIGAAPGGLCARQFQHGLLSSWGEVGKFSGEGGRAQTAYCPPAVCGR